MTENKEDRIVPEHIAIIMDGNGRWAEQHNVPRAQGHKAGCEALENTVEDCARAGIKYLTVYAFSTENWKRSEEEISALMALFRYYMAKVVDKAMKNSIRIRFIGDPSGFPEDIRRSIADLEKKTENNTNMVFSIALNYGGRDEIRRAVMKMAEDGTDLSKLTAEDISAHLDTFYMPDPDLVIRTSGELRLSNFMLWQMAYSEIYITDEYWPDFDADSLDRAITAFNKRKRRFGGR